MNGKARCVALLLMLAPLPALAQDPPPLHPPTHDISKVDPAPLGGAIAVPLSQQQEKQLRKYNIEELAGSRQALGSQLIDGRLPRPLLDYHTRNGALDQRLSLFEGGLVIVRMSGAGGTIQKRVIIPADAMKKYLDYASPKRLAGVRQDELTQPTEKRAALLRSYKEKLEYVERAFDPAGIRSRILHDAITPLEDLLRAISEDRAVTSTPAELRAEGWRRARRRRPQDMARRAHHHERRHRRAPLHIATDRHVRGQERSLQLLRRTQRKLSARVASRSQHWRKVPSDPLGPQSSILGSDHTRPSAPSGLRPSN